MKKKESKPGEWSMTVGDVPVMLTAYERKDRGNDIYTRLWDGKTQKAKRWLCGSIRDSSGRIVPQLEQSARASAIARQKAAIAGDDPTGPLTIRVGFRRMLDAEKGKFAAASPWKKVVTAYEKRISREIGDVLCSDLRHKHYRELWRSLAREHVNDGKWGQRAAVKMVGALRSMIAWCQSEDLLEQGTGLPAPGWAKSLAAEWAEITEKPITKPKKLRYTEAEQKKLWEHIGKADPRLALAMEVGAELRLGQVARAKRTDLQAYQGHEVGAVLIHGRGKKAGALVAFTDAQREAVTLALTGGYLSELEAAYRSGLLEDYHLLPAGRTLKGKAQVKHAGKMWDTRRMNRAWLQYEEKAGVEHVPGRAWYGTRRLQADLAEDVTSDARALNAMGGWTHTETRESYQEQGRTDVAERAKDARAQIRPTRKVENIPQKDSPASESGERDEA